MTSNYVGEDTESSRPVKEFLHRLTLGRLVRTPFYRMRFGPSAEHLKLIPQDLRTADPSFTTEVYHGHFGLAGAVATTEGKSPFRLTPPNLAWEEELHGFGWLRHFNASNNEQAIIQAKSLISDWIKTCSRKRGVAWQPSIVSRRIISWICHVAPLLEEEDHYFYDKVMWSLTQQLRYLSTFYQNIKDGEPRITALMALTFAGLCVGGQSQLLKLHLPKLRYELSRQILEDGGHISRHPWVPVNLMFDLLPLKQCFVALDLEPPDEIQNTLKRISPMLRFLRLGDGYLGRFNGMTATMPDKLATILSYDDYKLTMKGQAEHSGYSRIEMNKTIVVADTGAPVDVSMSGEAHAGCLSFEMSSGVYPIVVNCGAPGPANLDWRLTARTTPFHSTLSVNKNSSARLISRNFLGKTPDSSLLKGPDNITVECSSDPDEAMINASHDGFATRYNTIYSRKILLKENGRLLEGHEHLWPQDSTPSKQKRFPFSLHFHIHPDVQVTYAEDRQGVILTLANGEIWTFATTNLVPSLEETMFLADYRGPRRSLQIVLRGVCNAKAKFVWTLTKTQDADENTAPLPVPDKTPARLARLRKKLIFMDPDQGEDDFN
ncbi:MAG: heparinase II/III family protein [Methyloligellaceae bacterium]